MPTPAKKKPSTELATTVDNNTVALLGNLFPTEEGFTSVILPRLGMFSQDKFEKDPKTKKAELVQEAGVFYIEKQDEEETQQEDGSMKRGFTKTELGSDPIDVTIMYTRKQLSYYDSASNSYTSSPLYDNDDEVVPLWCNKAEVDRGTPAELKAKYPGVSRTGKAKSNLEDNKILYVLYEGEMYQLNLRGTSMYAFKKYAQSVRPNVPMVVTSLSSEHKESGDTEWNQMTFTKVRDITPEEANDVVERVTELRNAIEEQKGRFAERASVDAAFAAHKPLGDGKK